MLDVFNPTNQEFLASNYNSISNENESNFITDAADWVTKGVPLAVSSGVAQMWNSIGWAAKGCALCLCEYGMEERLFTFTALKGCRRTSKEITRAGCLRAGATAAAPRAAA